MFPVSDRCTTTVNNKKGVWERVDQRIGSIPPCQRSLHAAACWKDNILVFGGYDGHQRLNDLHCYNFTTHRWSLLNNFHAPSPRDRHSAVIYENSFVVFGGFDGVTRVDDLHVFDLESQQWHEIEEFSGHPPTARHSHSAVRWRDGLYIFGGYDGSYRSDFHEFNFTTMKWSQISASGDVPRARYRGTCVVFENVMILHGGHDGSRHLQDTHIFDFVTKTWSALETTGPTPSPRDSHVAVVYKKSMYIYGGSTGSAMGDFHELRINERVWCPVEVVAPQSANEPGALMSQHSAAGSSTVSAPPTNFGIQAQSITLGHNQNQNYSQQYAFGNPYLGNHSNGMVATEPSNFGVNPFFNINNGLGNNSNRPLLYSNPNPTLHSSFASFTSSMSSTNQFGVYRTNGVSSASSSYGTPSNPLTQTPFGVSIAHGPSSSPSTTHMGIPPVLGGLASALSSNAIVPHATSAVEGVQADDAQTAASLENVSTAISTSACTQNTNNNYISNSPSFGFPLTSSPATQAYNHHASHSSYNSTAPTANIAPLVSTSTLCYSTGSAASISAGSRFCHVGVVYDESLYVFGGYDGAHRLNDFLRFQFEPAESHLPPSTLVSDLRALVDNELLSDVTFIVEGIPVRAHKVLCLRCPYFRNLLTGEYMESRASEIVIPEVRHAVFLQFLQHVYADEVEVSYDCAMELFQAADRFGADRLKKACEAVMLQALSLETAGHILLAADCHNAQHLREHCMSFIVSNFDDVSKTSGFEEMARGDVELLFEILRRR